MTSCGDSLLIEELLWLKWF